MKVPATFDPQTGTLTVDVKDVPNTVDVLYHEDQVAEMFGVTVYTVRYWRRERIIGHVLVNRTVRFTGDQIHQFIENNSIPAKRTMEPTKAAI